MRQDKYYQETEGKIEESIERVVPHTVSHQTYLFHLTRYRFAASFLREKNVLDIGCGSGYGSFLLAQLSKEVTGIDYSQGAIDFANEHFQRDNLSFQKMHWKELTALERAFDGIVALEFLEHIECQQEFLQTACALLRKGGVFIVSTPNKDLSANNNPFHLREFSPGEFKKLLGEYFTSFRIYSQFLRPECVRRRRELQALQQLISWQTRVKLVENIKKAVSFKNKKEQISLSDVRSLEELVSIQAEDILFTSSQKDIQDGDCLVAVCKKEVL